MSGRTVFVRVYAAALTLELALLALLYPTGRAFWTFVHAHTPGARVWAFLLNPRDRDPTVVLSAIAFAMLLYSAALALVAAVVWSVWLRLRSPREAPAGDR